jgi:murein DD-endopeptidase MepM/ murein hydrolase activator NlpD
MKYSRGVVLFILLGAIVVLVLMINPRQELGDEGTLPSVVDITIAQPSAPLVMATPSVRPSETPPPTNLAVGVVLNPSITPLAYSPMQLQTMVSKETLLPDSTAMEGWNPPALEVPLAYHPYDHYWLIRPVGSNNTNFGLGYYPYGSDGPRNDLRIHHGIDIANPIGVEVYAPGSGTVVWAEKGHLNEYESITAYGNTVVIEHDFGYNNGQRVYTLYAHLSAFLVSKGEHVRTGQAIGLIGNTGQVTGPHVHFEVRVGRDSYFATRNPILWMVPYVGTGVIAGRVTFPNGGVVTDAVIMLIDQATGRVIERTNSYAGFGVTGDDKWEENFVFADVPVGRYLITSRTSTILWSGEVDVVPGTTNWVQLERYTPETSDDEAKEQP